MESQCLGFQPFAFDYCCYNLSPVTAELLSAESSSEADSPSVVQYVPSLPNVSALY